MNPVEFLWHFAQSPLWKKIFRKGVERGNLRVFWNQLRGKYVVSVDNVEISEHVDPVVALAEAEKQ